MLPEDTIITVGKQNKYLWFIADGKCDVYVFTNMRKRIRNKQNLVPGDYFGEISLIYGCTATATVQSVTYSICAQLAQNQFDKLKDLAMDAHDIIVEKTFDYNDKWIQFKVKLLQQIDYFKSHMEDKDENDQPDMSFFKQVGYHMELQHYQQGTEIFTRN